MLPFSGILPKDVFNPNLLNKPLVPCFLINIDFLLSHNPHFGKSISFPLFVFATLWFLLSASLLFK